MEMQPMRNALDYRSFDWRAVAIKHDDADSAWTNAGLSEVSARMRRMRRMAMKRLMKLTMAD
jgi:hypothetical protein